MPARLPIAVWLVAVALVCGGASAHARAQAQDQDQDPIAPFVGKVVASVRLEVEGRLELSPALLALIDVKAQQPFTREAYLSSARRLQRLAPYADVQVKITDAPAGLQVVFAATPFHPVQAMQFLDDAHVNLERRVKERYGGTPTDVDPAKVNDTVLDVLRGEGFMEAVSTPETVLSHNPCRATVVFHVTAGPVARIGNVSFENRSTIPNARLAAEIRAEKELPYQSRAIRESLDAIVNRLKRGGFFSASDELRSVPGPDHSFDLTIGLDPGPHVVLRWAKDSQPPSGDINEFVPIVQQNSIDSDLLDDSAKNIEQVLKNQGYLEAKVSHKTDITPEGEQVITYAPIRGPRYRIERVDIPDSLALKPVEIEKLLVLGRGDVLDAAQLSAGLSRIRNAYLSLGFYRVVVSAEWPVAENTPPAKAEVRAILRPKIVEGPRGIVDDVKIVRDTTQVREADLRAAISGSKGQPYVARADESERYALEGLYLDLGYRQAKVDITSSASADGQRITRVVHITEGPLITVGSIRVVGWRDISERAIREELTFGIGQPYSESARLNSARRINGMGVFTSVSVKEDPLLPGETEAHVVVRVVEAPDTTIAYGGGVEAGNKARLTSVSFLPDGSQVNTYVNRVEFAPRGFLEVDRHNLGGRNRTLGTYFRVSLRPRDSTDPTLDGKGYSFSEYRAAVTYNERRAFGTDIDWLLSLTSEQAIRTSFNFVRNAANADFIRRLTARTTANLRYSLDFTRLYDVRFTPAEKLEIDRIFNQVRLSMFSLAILTDHRDDALSPTRGTFTSGEGDVAARGIGSQVGFAKLFLQASNFHRLSQSPRVILALRGELGIARGFARPALDVNGNPISVADVPASQRFFAGGSTTVRGFPLDGLGVTPGVLTTDGSLGGNGVVVLNAEVRTTVGKLFGRNLSTVQFADAGNVFAKAGDIRLGQLRGSLGTGMRYDSPIGPLRIDFGFKLSRHTYGGVLDPNGVLIGAVRESRWEFHLSFGEAF